MKTAAACRGIARLILGAIVALVVVLVWCLGRLWEMAASGVTGGGDKGEAQPPRAFSYFLPETEEGVLRKFVVYPKGDEVVLTLYHHSPRDLNFMDPLVAEELGYEMEKTIHLGDEDHFAELHAVEDPYLHHFHLTIPVTKLEGMLEEILKRFKVKDAKVHAHLAAELTRSASAVDMPYPDGVRVRFELCTEKDGLDIEVRMKEMVTERLGERHSETEETQARLTQIIYNLRPATSAAVIRALLQRFHPQELADWSSPKGQLIHVLANQGSVEAMVEYVAALVSIAERDTFTVDVRRPADRGTPAHLAAFRATKPNASKCDVANGMAILEFLKDTGADFSLVNKYKESVTDILIGQSDRATSQKKKGRGKKGSSRV